MPRAGLGFLTTRPVSTHGRRSRRRWAEHESGRPRRPGSRALASGLQVDGALNRVIQGLGRLVPALGFRAAAFLLARCPSATMTLLGAPSQPTFLGSHKEGGAVVIVNVAPLGTTPELRGPK